MPKLYLVPTPIGNLADMTYRSVAVLKEVDLILAEDTRTSAKLLAHYGISTPMESNHQYNEHKKLDDIVNRLNSGVTIAVITDAGTPGISDPGFLLVRECVRQGIEVECLPGATAFVPALVSSGLPSDKFFFEGFLPHKKGRKSRLDYLKEMEVSIVFYESPYRLLKTLEQFSETFGEGRQACVARELSKMFEEIRRGSLKELINYFSEKTVKGEIVIIVEGDSKRKNKEKEFSEEEIN